MAISISRQAVEKSVAFNPTTSVQASLSGGAVVEYFRDNLTTERAILTITQQQIQINFHGTPHEIRDLIHVAQQVLDEALRQEHPNSLLEYIKADLAREPYRDARHPLDAERGR